MAISFFDLDETVFSVNLGRIFLLHAFRDGLVSRRSLPKAVAFSLAERVGWVSRPSLMDRAGTALRGVREADLRAQVLGFYEGYARRRIRPGARRAVDRHLRRGDICVVVTSWVSQLAEPVCRDLGFAAFLGNEFEVGPDGRFTGAVRSPVCFGEGKLTRARACAESRGERLAEATAYGNSARGDLPLLAAVSHPVVVAPDRALRRIARARCWPIEDWNVVP